MHIPPLTDACWTRLAASGQVPLLTNHVPTRVVLDRVRASDADLGVKAAELFAYFVRWSDSLTSELAQIRQL